MKKSELRAIIREMLQEELTKLNSQILNEAAEDDRKPKNTKYSAGAQGWKADALAGEIYSSEKFQDAFADDGFTIGDNVQAIVEKEVGTSYQSKNSIERAKYTTQVLAALRAYSEKDDKDSDLYDWGLDDEIDKIYKNTHDKFGTEY
jgi:hypothetical protein